MLGACARLQSTQQKVSAASIASELELSIWSTLYAISFHKAWGMLGLDRDVECVGPHRT